MTSISSIQSLILDLPPSCIAFCPARPEYFVVGTYHLHRGEELHEHQTQHADDDNSVADGLEKAPQTRSGTLILFRLAAEKISHICTVDTPGAVLDIQWIPRWRDGACECILAVATSVGRIEFYELQNPDNDGETCTIVTSKQYQSLQVADPDKLVLSLLWHPSRVHVIGFTLSDGKVCVCDIQTTTSESTSQSTGSVAFRTQEIFSHDLEAWTVAFTSTGAVLSGGDDAVLQCSDVGENDMATPRWRDRRTHMAGVTAILPLTPDLVLTGSYDDHIRLLSGLEGGGRRVVTEAEMDLGGGVWRLKLLESPDTRAKEESARETGEGADMGFVILASCMHAGTRVVRLVFHPEDGAWTFDVLAKFEEHQSMNYGSDFQPSSKPRTSSVRSIISTSFYDKLLCLWSVDLHQLEKEIPIER